MKYKYVARNLVGQMVKGDVEASTAQAAASLLREQKMMPISISQKNVNGININKFIGKVSASDLANFTRQLSTMITAGLPLTDALNLLKVQSGPALAEIVAKVLGDVQSGLALSSAMAKHPKVFNKVYVALVKAGETAGVMEKILMRLADSAEKSREFRAKVVGAMIYPVIIIIGMIGVTVVMMVVVIPKISALYADFNAELPVTTKMLMAASDFTIRFWWLLILMTVGGWYALQRYLATAAGRKNWDTLVYKIPVTGGLSQQVMMTELTRTLSLLVGSGVSVVEALNITADAIGNSVVKAAVQKIAHQVEKGFPLSICFSEVEVFPPLVGQMVAVGEETGKLDDVLLKLSQYFEMESSEKVKGLTTAIEPIILIVLAVGVGFLMYAIIIPIYQITNSI